MSFFSLDGDKAASVDERGTATFCFPLPKSLSLIEEACSSGIAEVDVETASSFSLLNSVGTTFLVANKVMDSD